MTPEEYMHAALKEAQKAEKKNEVPIGCVIVQDGKIIAKAHNLSIHKQEATAHAEVLAIQKALRRTGHVYLDDCDLYVTLEPCMMCAGAIELTRINRLYYGTCDLKGGAVKTLVDVKKIPHLNTYPREIHADILQAECADILSSFFRRRRREKKEEKNKQKETL
jgi:tRNA(adenine34) deaminase